MSWLLPLVRPREHERQACTARHATMQKQRAHLAPAQSLCAAEHRNALPQAARRSSRDGFGVLHAVFGVNLGDDVVDLLLRLGHELARLVAELVGAAHRRPE
jgi:hypothetical protein